MLKRSAKIAVAALYTNLFITSVSFAASCPDYVRTNEDGSKVTVPQMEGVLAKCIPKDAGFFEYARIVLKENTYLVVTGAVIMVIASGLQYMAAMGSTGAQGKAKERILAVVIGIIFFTLIRFILSIIGVSKT